MGDCVLHITSPDRYEVNVKNRAWRRGEQKRAGPLPYYRSKVAGHAWGDGYRRLLKVAGRSAAASCFGVFHKLLELGADQPADRRWYILDSNGGPLDVNGIVAATGFSLPHVRRAIEVLTDPSLRWLEWRENPDAPGDTRQNPGIPGISPSESESESDTESDTESDSDVPATPDSTSLAPPSDDSDSDSNSIRPANPSTLYQIVMGKLQAPRRSARQRAADMVAFENICHHIDAGHLGRPPEGVAACITLAEEIATEARNRVGSKKAIKSRLAYFLTVLRNDLEDRSIPWEMPA